MTQTVLITGCSSGFGKASAEMFAHHGWNVVATMRRPQASTVSAPADRLLVVELDVTDVSSIHTALEAGEGRFGHIDVVVNNAGVGLFSVFETTPMNAVRGVFETNVFGVMNVIQAIAPRFRAQGGGTIVNVSSGSGIGPDPMMSVYSASKHAVEGLSEGLYHELGTQGIAVKLVEPGYVQATNFVATVLSTMPKVAPPASYDAYVDQITRMFMEHYPMEPATEVEVASAIYTAASDGTDRLRYLAGADTAKKAKLRWSTSEDEYMSKMREMFRQRSAPTAIAA